MKLNIILVKKIVIPRQTENMYFQAVTYQHLWKENGKIENVFIVTMSDQFYNPETGKEILVSIEVHFQTFTDEKILNDYRDPEKRHKKAIPVISRMTFETQKILRKETLKVFNKADFKNIELPPLNLDTTIQIVVDSLPKMDKSKMPITIGKQNWVAGFVITMFSIISEATSKKEITAKGNKIYIREKNEDEIFEFTDEAENLKGKILDFFSNPTKQFLKLSKEESDLFRKCSHAAYYFETEKKKDDSKLRNDFIELHERFFKS